MIGQKLLIRLVGTLTCVAAVTTGWDAEAARCHRRRATCCPEACCPVTVCETSCCAPACATSCLPAYEQVCWTQRDPCTNCWVQTCGYRVIDDGWRVAPATACCTEVVVATTARPTTLAGSVKPATTAVAARR